MYAPVYAALAVLWVGMSTTCSDGPLNCYVDGDLAWRNAGLNVERDDPRDCPYGVSYPGANVLYSFKILAPDTIYDGRETSI